eukprot:6186010-Pleurochrysis_carterae.AAC.3
MIDRKAAQGWSSGDRAPGFMVASSRKLGAATTSSSVSPRSGTRMVRAGSSTELRRSSTESSASEISSISSISPRLIAVSSGPSAHAKSAPHLAMSARHEAISAWRSCTVDASGPTECGKCSG